MSVIHLAHEIFDLIYPVGSIYMTWSLDDPAVLFGGTWIQLKGGFLYGAVNNVGTGDTGKGTNTVGHTLTIDQMPNHGHNKKAGQLVGWVGGHGGGIGYGYKQSEYVTNAWGDIAWDIEKTGGGNSHFHKVPYIAVNVWRRTG